MAFDFYIDAKLGVVFSKADGVFDRTVALGHMDQLSRHPDFRPEFHQLADFRMVTQFAMTAEDVRQLAKRAIFSASSKRAFVVSSDLQFGLARMFRAHREMNGEEGIMIFREMREALDWLSLSAEPDSQLFPRLHPSATRR